MAIEAVAGLRKFLSSYLAYLMGFCKAGQKFPKPFLSALPILLRVNLVHENFLNYNLFSSLFYYKIS